MREVAAQVTSSAVNLIYTHFKGSGWKMRLFITSDLSFHLTGVVKLHEPYTGHVHKQPPVVFYM